MHNSTVSSHLTCILTHKVRTEHCGDHRTTQDLISGVIEETVRERADIDECFLFGLELEVEFLELNSLFVETQQVVIRGVGHHVDIYAHSLHDVANMR